MPILIHNDTDSAQQVTLRPALPAGWTVKPEAQVYTVGPHDTYPVSAWVMAPASAEMGKWVDLTWHGESQGKDLGAATLRGHVDKEHMPH